MAIGSQWQLVDRTETLSPDAVHVWRYSLLADEGRVLRLRELLSAEELARADRFKFDKHRRRFIVARATLRILLGDYFSAAPDSIEFLTTKYGKPYVRQLLDGQVLSFNVSHSHELALFAFTLEKRIGVDLEYRRQILDMESIAGHFFAKAEVTELMSLDESVRPRAFLNCWTRKEAYIKAIGEGLSHPLHTFEVTLKPGEPARLVSDAGVPDAIERWCFTALHPHPDYLAALAVEDSAESHPIICYDANFIP